eukprot:1160050-Pelagomonas_calceolata.AAC.4
MACSTKATCTDPLASCETVKAGAYPCEDAQPLHALVKNSQESLSIIFAHRQSSLADFLSAQNYAKLTHTHPFTIPDAHAHAAPTFMSDVCLENLRDLMDLPVQTSGVPHAL